MSQPIKMLCCCLVLFLVATVNCRAGDMEPVVKKQRTNSNTNVNIVPRLRVINNCEANAELLWKVTGNPQWDFLADQKATTRYSGPNQTGDKFYVFTLPPKGQKLFGIPDIGACSGAMSIMVGCSSDPDSDWDNCIIGAKPGEAAFGALPLYEATYGCAATVTDRSKCNVNRSNGQPLTDVDWFDLSAVNSYSLPFTLKLETPASYNCSAPEIDGSMLDMASCPKEGNATMTMTAADQVAYPDTYTTITQGFSLLTTEKIDTTQYNKVCVSPGTWLGTPGLGTPANAHTLTPSDSPINTFDWYNSVGMNGQTPSSKDCTGPGCGGPQTYRGINGNYTQSLPLTNYVKRLKEMGYVNGYTWQYDDGAGDISCNQGVRSTLTLCPGGGKPYSPVKAWWYNPGTNACELANSSTPKTAARYDALFTCQRYAINKYKLIKETLTSPNPEAPYSTQDIYYCTTSPSSNDTTTYTYDDCQTKMADCNAASVDTKKKKPSYCPAS